MKRIIQLIGLGLAYTVALVAFNFIYNQGYIENAFQKFSTEPSENHDLGNIPPPPFPPPPPSGGG